MEESLYSLQGDGGAHGYLWVSHNDAARISCTCRRSVDLQGRSTELLHLHEEMISRLLYERGVGLVLFSDDTHSSNFFAIRLNGFFQCPSS